MSNSPPHGDLKKPSEAYREAICSLVYRLSELMFGSLLAAYSLGFVASIGAHGSQLSAAGRWGTGLRALQYICISITFTCISITFAYLTTSFYLTYHKGILTMPQLPLERLGKDFAIAFFQAVIFGLSMVQPALFLLLLGFNARTSANRKNEEYKELADTLFNEYRRKLGRAAPRRPEEFSAELERLLQEKQYKVLSVWAPTKRESRGLSTWAIRIGAVVLCWYVMWEIATPFLNLENHDIWGIDWWRIKWFLQQIPIMVLVVYVTKRAMAYGAEVLNNHGDFLGADEMDEAFGNLLNEIAK